MTGEYSRLSAAEAATEFNGARSECLANTALSPSIDAAMPATDSCRQPAFGRICNSRRIVAPDVLFKYELS
jgi:hypothetical protein